MYLLLAVAFTLSSCTKESTEEIKEETQLIHQEKVLSNVNFISTSPVIASTPFIFQRVSVCNTQYSMITTTGGKISYNTHSPQAGLSVYDANLQFFGFTIGEWVFITPPTTAGSPQPAVNKVLKFRVLNSSFSSNAFLSFNRNTGLWTIPTSNGTWEAVQVNPSTNPC